MRNEPRLRFGDFSDDYKTFRLDEIFVSFIVPMRDKPKTFDGSIPWCRIEDLDGKYLSTSKTNQTVSNKTITEMNLKVFPPGTLIVSCSANLGICAITTNDLVTNQTFIGLVPSDTISVSYLYHKIRTEKRRLNNLSSGTTISYLSRSEFEKFKIIIPSKDEQLKVSSFLDLFEKKISLLEDKLETLKLFNTGIINKMFKIENGINGFGDKLIKHKVSDFLRQPEKILMEFDKTRLITVRLHNQGVFQSNPNKILKEGATNYYIRRSGQFIYGKQNFHNAAFGLVPKNLDGFGSSSDIPTFDFIGDVDKDLFVNFFISNSNYKRLEAFTTGTGSKRLSPTEFLNRDFYYFEDLSKEEKYSLLLKNIRTNIDILFKNLSTLKQFNILPIVFSNIMFI